MILENPPESALDLPGIVVGMLPRKGFHLYHFLCEQLLQQQFPLMAGSSYTSDAGTRSAGSCDELICRF